MEALLARVAGGFGRRNATDTNTLDQVDEEKLWKQIDDTSSKNLSQLSKQVASFCSNQGAENEENENKHSVEFESAGESEDEVEDEGSEAEGYGFDDAEEGFEDNLDADYNDIIDGSDFEVMDPKDQLKLLMRPVKDDKSLYDEDELDEDPGEAGSSEDDQDEPEEEDGKRRPKASLNLSENEEEADEVGDLPKSAFEKQQARLKRTIAELEAENVGEKEWALKGEVTARQRPKNSLLEEDLEFEHTTKVVPVITEEVTESIEDIIKRRIKDAAWDDVQRPSLTDTQTSKAAVPKPTAHLDDEKSKQSLAEIYEAEFEAKKKEAQSTSKKSTDLSTGGPVDEATKAAHDEIRTLFGKLCNALDMLSENKFAPRTYALADLEIKALKK